MTKSIPNPFSKRSMPLLVRMWLRQQMPSVMAACESLWRDGHMSNTEHASEEDQALLMTLARVTEEVTTAWAALGKSPGADPAVVLSMLTLGVFMSGYNLAQESNVPLMWAETEEEE